MPVATYGWEIGVAEQKINPSCSAELVWAGWREAFRQGRRFRLPSRSTGLEACTYLPVAT